MGKDEDYELESPERRTIDGRDISEQEYYERSTGLTGTKAYKKPLRGRKIAGEALDLIAQRVLVGMRKLRQTSDYDGPIHNTAPYNKRREWALQAASMTSSGAWYNAKTLAPAVANNFNRQSVTANFTPVTQNAGLLCDPTAGMADPPLGIVNITGADKMNYLMKLPVPQFGTLKRVKVSAFQPYAATGAVTKMDVLIYSRNPYANYNSGTGKSDVMGQIWEPNHIVYSATNITTIAALPQNAIKQVWDDVPLYLPYVNEDVFTVNQENINEALYVRLILNQGAVGGSTQYAFFVKVWVEEGGEAELAVREGLKTDVQVTHVATI